jgi:hypothetical protein
MHFNTVWYSQHQSTWCIYRYFFFSLVDYSVGSHLGIGPACATGSRIGDRKFQTKNRVNKQKKKMHNFGQTK